jgi:hypothetical protein
MPEDSDVCSIHYENQEIVLMGIVLMEIYLYNKVVKWRKNEPLTCSYKLEVCSCFCGVLHSESDK